MSFPGYPFVTRAFEELTREGKIRHRDQQEEVENDKGLLTRRAAYYVNQADPAYGILEKRTGNNSQGYSVDIIIRNDGTFWDVATDRDGNAQPVDGGETVDPGLIGRWRQPTRELAGLDAQPDPEPEPEPGPGPEPEPGPGPNGSRIMELLEQIAVDCKRQAEASERQVEAINKASADIVKAVKSFRLWAPPASPKRKRASK